MQHLSAGLVRAVIGIFLTLTISLIVAITFSFIAVLRDGKQLSLAAMADYLSHMPWDQFVFISIFIGVMMFVFGVIASLIQRLLRK